MPLSGAGHEATSEGGMSWLNVCWSSALSVERGLFRQSSWKLSVGSDALGAARAAEAGRSALTHLVKALVPAEGRAAAVADGDAVRAGHAVGALDVEGRAGHRRPSQVVGPAVVLARDGARGCKPDRGARAWPVVVIVRHLDAVEPIPALEADGDGRPGGRGVGVDGLVLDLYPAVGEEDDLEGRRLPDAVRARLDSEHFRG